MSLADNVCFCKMLQGKLQHLPGFTSQVGEKVEHLDFLFLSWSQHHMGKGQTKAGGRRAEPLNHKGSKGRGEEDGQEPCS